MPKYSEEVLFQCWNDDTGERIECGEDLDGLGLVEIRNKDNDNKVCQNITLTIEQAEWMMRVLPSAIGNAKRRASESR